MPVIQWSFWLYESMAMTPIAELAGLHQKQLTLQLDSPGKATGWMHLLDPVSGYVLEHETAIVAYRNGIPQWSGPIYQTQDQSDNTPTDTCNITAMGWFQILNQRILHTGAEFQAMLAAPNGVAWQAANGAYSGPGIESAIQLAYSGTANNTTFPQMAFDLLNRANIDGPTGITPGTIYGDPQVGNLTLQQFQNIGEQITNLTQQENGFDFVIDPLTKVMDIYCQQGQPSGFAGYGQDRGQGCLFT